MEQFQSILQQLGFLHDARVLSMLLDAARQLFTIEIDDMYSNFIGLPEYHGPKSAKIELLGISHTSIELTSKTDGYNIDDFSVQLLDDKSGIVSITFWPAGKVSTVFRDVRSTLEKIAL